MKQPNKPIIVLTGGGTAGHIFPLMAVSESLQEMREVDICYLGSGAKLEADSAAKYGINYKKVLCGKIRRYITFSSVFLNILDIFKLLIGSVQALVILLKLKPDVIFSKGGYVCIPTIWAASVLSIPVISHESDVLAGLANRYALRHSKMVAVSFPTDLYGDKIRKKAVYTGLPLRADFDRDKEKVFAGDHILIIGGSQGAQSLNEIIFSQISELIKISKVVHVTGEADFEKAKVVKESLFPKDRHLYEIIPFSDHMSKLIAEAKLVVSRAGASAIFEIAAFNKNAIFVPIDPAVTLHQLVNCQYLEKLKLAQVFVQGSDNERFLSLIKKGLASGEPNLKSIYFPQSSKLLAQMISDEIDYSRFKKIEKVFLVGIEGVSMKGLAQVLTDLGKEVRGSDLKLGGHSKDNITSDLELVIYTSAVNESSPAYVEIEQARKLKIETVKRSVAIGTILKGYRGISVSGMHGKTSVSSLIARILEANDFDPSYLIGAPDTNRNRTYKLGGDLEFVAEACEYDGSFLDFPTHIAVITNIEEEHLDYFKGGIAEIKKTFETFIRNIYPGGVLIYSADDTNIFEIIKKNRDYLLDRKIKLISYGSKPTSDYCLKSYKFDNGLANFEVKHGSGEMKFEAKIPGRHFALNAIAAIAVSRELRSSPELFMPIRNFLGAARRFEFVGTRNGIMIYDDYGHHPTEIAETLQAFRDKFKKNRIFLVYEPHQQSRFDELYKKFVFALRSAKVDAISILPVYRVAGRDSAAERTSEDLVKELKSSSSKQVAYFSNYDEVDLSLAKNLRKGDVLITMGATDVYKIGVDIMKGKYGLSRKS